MSIKIWTAYKINSRVTKNHTKFWDWIRDTIDRGEKEATAVIRGMYERMMSDNGWDTREEYKTFLGSNDDTYSKRLSFCHMTLIREFKKQDTTMERNEFDLNCSIAIREFEGNLYLIPYCDMFMRDALNFLKKDKRLTDFSYWNNTDRPRGVSHRRWKERERIWKGMGFDERNWRNYLTLEISSYTRFSRLDPFYTMEREHSSTAKRRRSRPNT